MKRPPSRDGTGNSCVLSPDAMSLLPCLRYADVDAGPRVDEPSWRCRALWVAVVDRLLHDARGRGGFGAGQQTAAQRFAREWFRSPSADRAFVLEMAGIDLQAFISCGLPRLEAKWKWLDQLKLHSRHVHTTFRRKAA